MRRIAGFLFRSFLQGIVILGPIGITAYAIIFVFRGLDGMLPWFSEQAPGIGFLIIVAFITIVGYSGTRFFFGRWLVEGFSYLLEHTPGIKHIYSSVKDVMDSFVGDKKKFNHPVWVRTNANPEIWRIGFLTQNDLTDLGQPDKVSVYLPHSYAISGWVIIVSIDEVKPVEGMNAAEAMKFAVSGGIAGMHHNVHEAHH
ncbi:DUF502 domain-containing protein [Taibaiella lutea]|uniref:DUF502 domain-containing protein n=1 Tax=Taibaiella lutea TaxID=2608001 RepID=A0A5M6CPK1_9BACT|nr:DUF502 domain-containing protein [Taibaiella lutea]KAA5537171.1 DUF502 domain-containing protein [Taibaiella lutea]